MFKKLEVEVELACIWCLATAETRTFVVPAVEARTDAQPCLPALVDQATSESQTASLTSSSTSPRSS